MCPVLCDTKVSRREQWLCERRLDDHGKALCALGYQNPDLDGKGQSDCGFSCLNTRRDKSSIEMGESRYRKSLKPLQKK